jgi:hypothetical protein
VPVPWSEAEGLTAKPLVSLSINILVVFFTGFETIGVSHRVGTGEGHFCSQSLPRDPEEVRDLIWTFELGNCVCLPARNTLRNASGQTDRQYSF